MVGRDLSIDSPSRWSPMHQGRVPKSKWVLLPEDGELLKTPEEKLEAD